MGSGTSELIKAIGALVEEGRTGGGLRDADSSKKTVVAEVVRLGDKLIVPEGMTLNDAMRSIKAKMDDEENVVQLSETFDVFVWEGVYAMAKTLDDLYGWFQQIETPGGFFEPDQPPAMISVKTGPDDTVQVPWGRFRLPNMPKGDGYLETSYQAKPGEIPKFRLTGQLKKKHSLQFHNLCVAIRKQLTGFSLYKGKPITVKFFDEDGDRLKFPEPDFMKIGRITREDLIFSRHIETVIEANLFTPITKTQQCREYGIPLKRGVGLAGPYGTGKTLIAQRTASLAQEHGWTYIVCQSVNDFPDCVRFAQRYQPAIVFCEDIDKATKGDRDKQMDDVLNTIDGVNAKNTEIILVLTTNEIEKINQAMLRPGRLDVIVHVDRPDAEAVTRLIRRYAGDLLPASEDLMKIGKAMADSTPAVIREIVERSKLAAVHLMAPGEKMHLSQEAFLISADTMKMHRKLMDVSKKEPMHAMEVLGNVLGKYITAAVEEAAGDGADFVDELSALPSSTDMEIVRVVGSNGEPLHETKLDAMTV